MNIRVGRCGPQSVCILAESTAPTYINNNIIYDSETGKFSKAKSPKTRYESEIIFFKSHHRYKLLFVYFVIFFILTPRDLSEIRNDLLSQSPPLRSQQPVMSLNIYFVQLCFLVLSWPTAQGYCIGTIIIF